MSTKTILWFTAITAAIMSVVSLATPGKSVTCDTNTVVAQYGDTLWDIGYKHCGGSNANMEEVRYQMVKLNGNVIQHGQTIILP